MAQELLTTPEALKRAKISRSTLERLIREGKLTPITIAGRRIRRFRAVEIDALFGGKE